VVEVVKFPPAERLFDKNLNMKNMEKGVFKQQDILSSEFENMNAQSLYCQKRGLLAFQTD
jgi:hypothetical protein